MNMKAASELANNTLNEASSYGSQKKNINRFFIENTLKFEYKDLV